MGCCIDDEVVGVVAVVAVVSICAKNCRRMK